MTTLAQPVDSPTHLGRLYSSIKPGVWLIAILALLSGSIFMTATCESALLLMAMLASLGSIRLASSSRTSQLADDLQAFAMAALGTIAVLYLLA